MQPIPLRIAAVGRYLPERVVTASELDDLLGVRPGWVLKKTGVAERRWVAGETPVEMGARAAEDALRRGGVGADEIDLLVYAAATPEQLIPDTACLVQRALGLGASGIKAFSVHSTCLSFLAALDLTASHVAAGRHETVLIVSAEIASLGLDLNVPESAALFGDMATAVLVRRAEPGSSALRSLVFRTYGDGGDLCRIEGGGPYRRGTPPPLNPQDNLFQMDGRAVFRHASRTFPPVLDDALRIARVGRDEIDLLIPHQGSLRGLRSIHRACGVPDEKVVVNLQRLGNCVACSLPGAMYDAVCDGRVSAGDTVVLAGTGAGLSVAAAVLTW